MNAPELPAILIVDDTEDDVFFLRRALAVAKIRHRCICFEDGTEVLIYLKGLCAMAAHGPVAIPHAIFLDVRMPRVGGFEVLEWIKHQSVLTSIRCMMISTSDLVEDRRRAAQLGACTYLLKNPTAGELAALFRSPAGAEVNG